MISRRTLCKATVIAPAVAVLLPKKTYGSPHVWTGVGWHGDYRKPA